MGVEQPSDIGRASDVGLDRDDIGQGGAQVRERGSVDVAGRHPGSGGDESTR